MNSADRGRETFPEVEANIGEDPARWLDRPLFGGSANTSSPGLLIRDRIKGIDSLGVLGCFETVERRLERGPREKVLELIAARRETLLENGQRPELPTMTRDERVERARELHENLADKKRDHVFFVEDDGERVPYGDKRKGTASAKLNRISTSASTDSEADVATDGGRSE